MKRKGEAAVSLTARHGLIKISESEVDFVMCQ